MRKSRGVEDRLTRAADRLVECLIAQGADRLFCVPGESYLALLDALHGQNAIDVVVCRHEGGAGLMALADGKLTGRPGLLAVSRGPGATNAAIAIHSAEQDAVPLVVLVGQVARDERGRGAFQEVDYGKTFADMAKAVWEVHDARQLPEVVARAFRLAVQPTAGPVVIALPEDMLLDGCPAPAVPALPASSAPPPSPAAIAEIRARLAKAERPLLIAGGLLEPPAGRAALAKAAKALNLPVVLTFKRQEIFDNANPLYAGHLGFKMPRAQVEPLQQADLILAVGARLNEVSTQGYTLPQAPVPAQPLIHVHPDPSVPGRIYRTDLALAADPVATLDALAEETLPGWPAWAAKLHAAARPFVGYRPRPMPDGIDFGAMVQALGKQAPADAIVTTDAGNFGGWVHGLWPWNGRQLCIGAVGGAMGLGVPGAVAACLRHPERTVIAFVGDGGLMMTGNELATAIALGAAPKIVVSNNGGYATIRLHQEKAFPGRPSGTGLVNPDFARWAQSFGARGITVARPEDVDAAAREALAEPGPVVVDVRSSMEAVSIATTISRLRGTA